MTAPRSLDRAVTLGAAALGALLACSSSSSPPAGSPADAGADAASSFDAAGSCAPPGTPNNDEGVGGACVHSSDCPQDAGLTVCSSEFGAPSQAWFCTKPCVSASDCGSGDLVCYQAGLGKGCVPVPCLPYAGGVDASAGD